MAMLGIAAATDGEPLLSDTPELRKAELAGGTVYMLMQCYYTVRETMNLMAMRRALHDYYDSDTYGMLAWMQQSIVSLMLLALMVPLVIFGYGRWLLLIALIIYFTIFYLVDSFCSYLNSNAPARVLAAEVNAEEVEQKVDEEGKIPPPSEAEGDGIFSDEAMEAVGVAVEAWTAREGHCQPGLLLPLAAADIGIPKYRLTCWLHYKGMKYTDWIAALRVEEAKRTIKAHPEWQNEAVAEHCGFTERTMLRTFKKLTGMTPAQYAEKEKGRT
jgi:AraC-like DNA-binding protein